MSKTNTNLLPFPLTVNVSQPPLAEVPVPTVTQWPETTQYPEVDIPRHAEMIEGEPCLATITTAQLPYLPAPLMLKHGPLLATVERWSDGTVVAKIPALALYAEGESDTMALEELGKEILDFATNTKKFLATHEVLGGTVMDYWNGLVGLVDTSGLPD